MSRGRWNSPIFIQGQSADPNRNVSTFLSRVGPGYFESMAVPLVSGRVIGAEDAGASPKVAVVNQATADYFFPQGDAIGHRFKVADPSVKGEWEIVGVVRNTKYCSPREEQRRMVYLPVMQLGEDDNYAYWLEVWAGRRSGTSGGSGTRGTGGD